MRRHFVCRGLECALSNTLSKWDGTYSGTWVAHGVHFNRQEISRSVLPKWELHTVRHQICYWGQAFAGEELEHAGAKMGIGVDGSASNDSGNLITEVRQAMYLQNSGIPPSGSRI